MNSTDGDKVKVNLPLPLIKVFLDAGMSMDNFNISMGTSKGHVDASKRDIDWQKIILLVESGVVGKIVEVESADGDTVEVVVE